MTVIFACTFPGGAAIASDTLMHNPETNERVMNAPKVLGISQRVSVAQAGSFNGTGSLDEAGAASAPNCHACDDCRSDSLVRHVCLSKEMR